MKQTAEEKLLELKSTVERFRTERDRLVGSRTELLKQLKESYDCASTKEGRVKRQTMSDQLVDLDKKLTEHMVAFEKKYGIGAC